MITYKICRNGEATGISIIPTRNVHNPYFLFGAEVTNENMAIYTDCHSYAKLHYGRDRNSVFGEYTMRCFLLFIHFGGKTPWSYPEIGILNDSQSYLAFMFIRLHQILECDIEIHTVSECLIRATQVCVAKKLISKNEIRVLDEKVDDNTQPGDMSFQIPDELSIS